MLKLVLMLLLIQKNISNKIKFNKNQYHGKRRDNKRYRYA